METPVRTICMNILESRALGANLYRVTIAANEKVRQPPELDFDGLSIENYARNPVVMWAHDTTGRSPSGGLPIGRTLNLTKTPDGRIVAEFEFLSDDPFAQRVQNAWDKGFVQAASISWIPLETAPVEGGGWRDVKAELLEWSIVAVPADPDALREAHRRMVEAFIEGLGIRDWGLGDNSSLVPRPQSLIPDPDLAEIREMVGAIRSALSKQLLESALADR
jgi:hypothetical protein